MDSFEKCLDEVRAALAKHGVEHAELQVELMDAIFRCVRSELVEMRDRMIDIVANKEKDSG